MLSLGRRGEGAYYDYRAVVLAMKNMKGACGVFDVEARLDLRQGRRFGWSR